MRLQCRPTGQMNPKLLKQEASFEYTSLAQKLKAGEATLSSEKGKYLDDGQ